MAILIAGSRSLDRVCVVVPLIREYIERNGLIGDKLVCGMARGVDEIALYYWRRRGWGVIERPADWDRYGRGAGHRRNAEMAVICSGGLIVWDGVSSGTFDMMAQMTTRGRKFDYVKVVNGKVSWKSPYKID